MAGNETIRNFLMMPVGYGRVKWLMEGKKPLDKTVKEFLEGTVLGTWGDGATLYDSSKSHMPTVPEIRRDGNSGWQIRTEAMLKGKSPEQIEELVIRLRDEAFPGAEMLDENVHGKVNKRDAFTVAFNGGGVHVLVRGYRSEDISSRSVTIGFDLPPEDVSGINGVVSAYQQILKKAPFPQPLKVFSGMEVSRLSSAPVADVSLVSLVRTADAELLAALRAARPPLYDPQAAYKPGSLVTHLSFGYGVVTGVNVGIASVYFPKHSEAKALMCKSG